MLIIILLSSVFICVIVFCPVLCVYIKCLSVFVFVFLFCIEIFKNKCLISFFLVPMLISLTHDGRIAKMVQLDQLCLTRGPWATCGSVLIAVIVKVPYILTTSPLSFLF